MKILLFVNCEMRKRRMPLSASLHMAPEPILFLGDSTPGLAWQ